MVIFAGATSSNVSAQSPAAVVAHRVLARGRARSPAAVQLQAERERAYPPAAATDEAVAVHASGAAVRRLSVAYAALAADVYWIRAIQYYGGTKQRLDRAAAADAAGALAASRRRSATRCCIRCST